MVFPGKCGVRAQYYHRFNDIAKLERQVLTGRIYATKEKLLSLFEFVRASNFSRVPTRIVVY